MNTRAYFGDGVYGTFDGFYIVLQANGVGTEATDTVHLERGMLQQIMEWEKNGYRDHDSGQTFAEACKS